MYKQNTPEWLEMRRNYIGGSDAPCIMGDYSFTTPFKRWQEKMGLIPCKSPTPAMERGHLIEEKVREKLKVILGRNLTPSVEFHPSIQYMMASLDAIDEYGEYAAEIKAPNKVDHEFAKLGKVPHKYFPQLQHQIKTKERDWIEYVSYYQYGDYEDIHRMYVYRDEKYIKKLLEKEDVFWQCMQNFVAPELTEKDYEINCSDEWKELAQELIILKESLKTYDELLIKHKKLEERFKELSNHRNCMGEGIKVTHYFRKGSIDYSQIPELKNLNMEVYRNKPTECFRISCM